MSQVKVKKERKRKNGKRRDSKPTYPVPKDDSKFDAIEFDSLAGKMSVVIDGGEVKQRDSTNFPPLKYFNDPLGYFQVAESWGKEFLRVVSSERERLEGMTIEQRREELSNERKAYRDAQAAKRAIENPDVVRAIATDPTKLASATDSMSAEERKAYFAQLLAIAQAQLSAGAGDDEDEGADEGAELIPEGGE